MSYRGYLLDMLENLEKNIESDDIPLSRKLKSCQPAIKDYLSNVIHLPFTIHDWHHSEKVEKLCIDLIPEKVLKKLKPKEIYILILGLWLHDGGMVPEYQDQSLDDVRKDHHIRIKDKIDTNTLEFLSDIGLKEREALGILCASHCYDNIDDIPDSFLVDSGLENDIRLKILAAILRLCDICDVSSKRTPWYIYNNFRFNKESRKHWKKHLLINGLNAIHDLETTIKIQAYYANEEDFAYLNEIEKSLNKEISILSPTFSNFNWIISRKIITDFKEKDPKGEKDLKVLSNNILRFIFDHIYEDKTIYIRELIQNSIDAHKIKSKVLEEKGKKYGPFIKIIEYYREENKKNIPIAVVVQDNGIGMNQSDITDKLLEIGHQTRNDPDIINLLKYEKLIAKFGIGFLSCLPIANKIIIETQKENFSGLKIEFPNYNENNQEIPKNKIKVDKLNNSGSGTTIKIFLNEQGKNIQVFESIKKFCYDIDYPIFYSSQKWVSDEPIINLKEITDGRQINYESNTSKLNRESKIFIEHLDSGIKQYDGTLGYVQGRSENRLIVCQEGIFIEDCSSLIPDHFSGIEGEINLKTGLIELTASRNRINRDNKFSKLKESLEPYFFQLLGKVVLTYPVGVMDDKYGKEHLPILKILNTYCKKFEKDGEKLKIFFAFFERSVFVHFSDTDEKKTLFQLRKMLEDKIVSEISHIIEHTIIVSAVQAGTIEQYDLALYPKFTKIKAKSLSKQNKIVFRTFQVTQDVEKEEHYDDLLLKREFYRLYFELYGYKVNKYEPSDISPMVFNYEPNKYPQYEWLISGLQKSDKIRFFSTNESIRFLLDDKRNCYVNVSHPKIKYIFGKCSELKNENKLGSHFEKLISAYFLLTSFNIHDSLEKMEDSMIEYLDYIDEIS